VRIETQGNVYCMDQREVNWGEYKAFMTAKGGDTSGQPTECDWNTSFEPEYFPVDSGVEVDPTHKCPMDAAPTSDDVAANCLDFCDALSYCESVGKRLCGRIGGPKKWGRMNVGGNSSAEKNAIAKLAATSEMEFGHACTQGSKSTYPYGDAYEPGRCLDAEWVSQKGKDSLQITNLSNRTCHGAQSPFDQIYDLSGSVEEWQNLCFLSGAGPTGTGCLAIGAGFMQTDPADFACAGSLRFRSSKEKGPAVGVRCCADAVPI
jgi:formylglycine-generating enzyme required for sulfatase activity